MSPDSAAVIIGDMAKVKLYTPRAMADGNQTINLEEMLASTRRTMKTNEYNIFTPETSSNGTIDQMVTSMMPFKSKEAFVKRVNSCGGGSNRQSN